MFQLAYKTHSKNHIIPGFGKVTFKYNIEPHYEADHSWEIMGELYIAAKKIGTIKMNLFEKDKMGDDFYGIMDIHSDEAIQFARSIFNSEGKIKPALLSNPAQKGSGVWGTEINNCCPLIVEKIEVDKEFRKKRVGCWLLGAALHIPEIIYHCDYAFAWPAVIVGPHCTESKRKRVNALALKFFHDAGFRRVGRTYFLGFALKDAHHPSRSLPIDRDPPTLENDDMTPEEAIERFPIHAAIAVDPDAEAVKVIHARFAADPKSILEPDCAGNTPLHMAACSVKLEALCEILKYTGPQATTILNNQGLNALETLQSDLLNQREFINNFFGIRFPFQGISKPRCMILLELSRAMNKPIPSIEPGEEEWTAFKWGCTCGQCLGGWLSPRLKYRLQEYAETVSNNLIEHDFPARKLIQGGDFTLVSMADYIPPSIRTAGIYPSYLKAYGKIFKAISKVLGANSNTLLSKEAIMDHITNNMHRGDDKIMEYYFSRGGRVENALFAIIHTCWRDGLEIWIEEIEELRQKYYALPECINDKGYSVVCDCLNLPSLTSHR